MEAVRQIDCPHCQGIVPIPVEDDLWVIFQYCPHCQLKIAKRDGDCCILRSYGDAPCPHGERQ